MTMHQWSYLGLYRSTIAMLTQSTISRLAVCVCGDAMDLLKQVLLSLAQLPEVGYNTRVAYARGGSSAGRASALQAEGQGFESPSLHHFLMQNPAFPNSRRNARMCNRLCHLRLFVARFSAGKPLHADAYATRPIQLPKPAESERCTRVSFRV